MDTRTRIFLLLDYKEYYGVDKTIADAEDLIRNIPSATLLNYISGISINIYLQDNSDETGKVQFMLVNSLLGKCEASAQQKWAFEIRKQEDKGHSPIMFWNYSNLLFYGLIFQTYNTLPSRDLTSDEAQRMFDAYLIINGVANSKIIIEGEDVQKAEDEGRVEDVTLPSLIYQKDYASTNDFSNQVTRGVEFFKYLENDPKYGIIVPEYYASKNVSGFLRMFKNLLIVFTETRIVQDNLKRKQLANLHDFVLRNEVDLAYIETLCINTDIDCYLADNSFSSLRKKFLYKLSDIQFLILDVNFLIDQFYKAQIFSFNAFLKSKNVKAEFLSEKGKKFMEDIYLPSVLDICFSDYIRFYGDSCTNSNKDELCDAYLRDSNKICLIEFKDVLLNASIKNSADKESLLSEFDKKFVANQTKRPKGITQLINAIKDIAFSPISFDESASKENLEIYPAIVYTDLSFGAEGINKIYKEKFRKELKKLNLKNIVVKDVTFINLSFFEIREDYFASNLLNLFDMLNAYHKHTEDSNYNLTSFEVFSRFYMNEYAPQDLGPTSSFLAHMNNILTAK